MISLDACILDNADPSLCSSQNNMRDILFDFGRKLLEDMNYMIFFLDDPFGSR